MAKSFNIVAELQLQGPKNLNQITRQIAKSLKGVSVDVNVKIPKSVAAQLNQVNKSLQSLNTVASQANQKAAQLSSGLQKIQKASAAAASANKKAGSAIGSTSKQLKEATSAAESFGKQSALAVKRFAAFSVSAGIMGSVVMSLKNGVSAAIEFERELVKVAQVTNKSLSSLSGLTKEISSLSTSLGASSQELVGVSRTLAQTGLSARDVTVALKALAQSSLAPTFKDMNNTVEGAISIMRQFGVSADDIGKKLGSINALAGSFAVEAQDLVFAVRRAGGAFQAAGGSLEELLSLFTSVRATTRESAETIATGFRTIFTRIQRPKTIAFLRETGVELQNLEGNFVGPFQAIQRLSKALRQMESTDPRFMQIIEELGGFRQVSKVIPLIQQFGTAQKALGVAMAGQDSLAKDAATAQQSLGVQIVKVREQFLALARDLVASDSFQGMAKMALSFASSLIKVVESVKPLLPLLTTLATFKTLQLGVQFAGGFASGFGASGGARGMGRRLGGGRRMATGGVVPGVGNTDSVPAMLTPGEFVIRKKAVQAYGADNLARMNSGGLVQKFRNGTRGTGVKKPSLTKEQRAQLNNPPIFDVDGAHGVAFLQRGGYTGATQQLEASISTLRASTQKKLQQVPSIKTASQRSVFGDQLFKKIKISTYPRLYSLDDAIRKNFEDNVIGGISNKMRQEVNRTFDGVGAPNIPLQDLLSKSGLNSAIGQIGEGFVRLAVAKSPKLSEQDKKTDPEFDFSAGSMKDEAFKVLFGTTPQGPLELKNTAEIDKPDLISKAINEKEIASKFRKRAVKKAAGGGISGSDTVPALLTPGEFVINRKSAQRIGYGNLNTINKGGGIRGYASGGQVHKFNTGGTVPGSTTMGGPGSIPGMKKTAQANNNLAKSANKAAKNVGDSASAALGLSNRMQMLYFLPSAIQSFANTLGLAGDEFNAVTGAVNQAVMSFSTLSMITRSDAVQNFMGQKGMGPNKSRLPRTMRRGGRMGMAGANRFIRQTPFMQRGVGKMLQKPIRGIATAGGAMGSVGGITMLGTAAMTAASMLKAYGEAQKQAAMELVSNAEATETDFAKARGMAATGNRASSAGTGMMVGMGAGALAGAAIGTAVFPGIGTVGGAAIGGMLGMTAGGIAGDVLGTTSYDPALERQIQSTKFGQTTGRMQEGIQRIQQEGISAVDVTSVLNEAGAGIEQRDEAFDFKQFKEFRSSLRQQLPALKALKSEMLKSADSVEDFQDEFGGAGRELQEKIADIEGVDVSVIVARDKAERELIEKLGANKSAQEAAIRAQQDVVRQLDIFKGSLQETSESLNEMVLANSNAVASFGGGIGKRTVGSAAARGGIFSRAAAGQVVDADALEKAITNIAPTQEMKDMAQSAANASQKLPDALFKAARESKLTGEKLELTLANELKAAGIGGAVAQSIQASIEGMTLSTQGSEQKLVNEIFGGGSSDVAAKAIESLVGSGLLESFQEITNKLNEQAAQLDAAFGQIIQAERKLAKQRIGLINTRASNRQTLAMAQGASQGRTAAEIGPQGRMSGLADFAARQQAILGQGRPVDTSAMVSTSAADVQALGNRFITLQTQIADMTNREARGETLDPGEVKELDRLREEAQQAGDNLNFLAESTDLLKNAQDRLAKEQAKRQFRTGIATDFAFGTQETRQSMAMSMGAVDAFNRYSQGTGNLGPQALNAMGEAGQQAAAGGRQMLEQMAAAGVQYQGRDASEILRETTRRQLKDSPLGQGLTQDALDNLVDEMLDPTSAEVEAIDDMRNAMEIQEAAQSQLISAQTVLLDGIGAGILGLNPEFQGLREQFVNASNDAANAQVTATKAVEDAIREQMAQDAETTRMTAEAEAATVTQAAGAGINTQEQAKAIVQISKQQEKQKKLQEEADAMLPEAFRGVTELPDEIRTMAGSDGTALGTMLDRADVSMEGKKSAVAMARLASKIQSRFQGEGLINDDGGVGGRRRREDLTREILTEEGFDPDSDVSVEISKTLRNLVDAGTWFGGMDSDQEKKMLQDTVVNSILSQGQKRKGKLQEVDKQQRVIDKQAQKAKLSDPAGRLRKPIDERTLELAKAREKIDDKTAKKQVAAVEQAKQNAETQKEAAEAAKKAEPEKVDTKEVTVDNQQAARAEATLTKGRSQVGIHERFMTEQAQEMKAKHDERMASDPSFARRHEKKMSEGGYYKQRYEGMVKQASGPAGQPLTKDQVRAKHAAEDKALAEKNARANKETEEILDGYEPPDTSTPEERAAIQKKIEADRKERDRKRQAEIDAAPAGGPPGGPPMGPAYPQAVSPAAESSRAAEFNMDEIMARANQIKSLPKGTPTSEGGADLRTRRAAYRARQGEELTREEKQLLSGQEISGEEGGRGTDSKEGGSLQQALQQFIETEQLSAALNNFSEQFGGDGAIKHELSGTDISVTFSGLEEIKGAFQEEIISQVIKRLGDTRNPNPDPSKPVQT